MTMTPEKAAALLANATQGEWYIWDQRHQKGGQIKLESRPVEGVGEYNHIANILARRLTHKNPEGDAALIVAAPDLARLVIQQAERIAELEANSVVLVCRRCQAKS